MSHPSNSVLNYHLWIPPARHISPRRKSTARLKAHYQTVSCFRSHFRLFFNVLNRCLFFQRRKTLLLRKRIAIVERKSISWGLVLAKTTPDGGNSASDFTTKASKGETRVLLRTTVRLITQATVWDLMIAPDTIWRSFCLDAIRQNGKYLKKNVAVYLSKKFQIDYRFFSMMLFILFIFLGRINQSINQLIY